MIYYFHDGVYIFKFNSDADGTTCIESFFENCVFQSYKKSLNKYRFDRKKTVLKNEPLRKIKK